MDAMYAAEGKAAEPVRKSDAPRLPTEIDALLSQIEKANALVGMLTERLAGVLVPSYEESDRALDSVPSSEPSPHARSIIAARERVRDIAGQIDGLIQRLEI